MRFNFLVLQWGLDWLFNRVPSGTQNIMDFYIFYPFPDSLSLSTNHFGSLPVSLLLNVFEKDWFARGNLWIYTCFILNSLTSFHAFWLYLNSDNQIINQTSYLQRYILATVVAVTFSYSLTRIYYIVHAQTLPNFATPYFFYFGFRAVRDNSLRSAIIAGLFFSWQFYLDIHLCLMSVFIVICLGPFYLGFIARSLNRFKKNIFPIFVFCIICTIICSPLLLPYLKTAETFGPRSLKEAKHYAPKEKDFFRPPIEVNLYKELLPRTVGEKVVFSSILSWIYALCLLLTSIYLVVRNINDKLGGSNKSGLHIIAPLAAIIPGVLMFDFMIHNSPVAKFIHLYIPGFSSIRTPGRFSIIFLAVIITSWIILILKTGIFNKFARMIIITLCMTLLVLLIETSTIHFKRWEKPHFFDLDKVFATLKGPTFMLPAGWDILALNRMQMAAKHQIKLANGYSGFQPYSFYYIRNIQNKIKPENLVRYLLEKYYQEVVVDLRQMPIGNDFLNRFGRTEAHYAVFSRKAFNLPDVIPYYGFELWRDDRNYFYDIEQYNPETKY
jgi:hypothetical protein